MTTETKKKAQRALIAAKKAAGGKGGAVASAAGRRLLLRTFKAPAPAGAKKLCECFRPGLLLGALAAPAARCQPASWLWPPAPL